MKLKSYVQIMLFANTILFGCRLAPAQTTFSSARAAAVNDFGVIVGSKCSGNYPATICRATLWYGTSFVLDLGTLHGGTSSSATGINSRGQVVGWSTTAAGATHAFLWWGSMHDLGTVASDMTSVTTFASAINNRGEVVGRSCNAYGGVCKAVVWRNGMAEALAAVPCANPSSLSCEENSSAEAINDTGEIVGSGTITTREGLNQSRPLIWNKGRVTVIGTLQYDEGNLQLEPSFATTINERGEVAGYVTRPFINSNSDGSPMFGRGSYIFSWAGQTATTLLPTLPGYGPGGRVGPAISSVRASGINEKGQIVGSALINVCAQNAAFVIQDDKMTQLPHLATRPNIPGPFPPAECGSSEANAINESGLIVGTSFDGSVSRAVIWKNGVIKALN
jgi:probable HAF family extracellular repeat protein